MASITSRWRKKNKNTEEVAAPSTVVAPVAQQAVVEVINVDVDIAPTDPLLAYLQNASNPVELGRLNLQSPALDALRAADVAVVVPLVSQGELIGIVNLGQRLSEQEYSTDDRKLLNDLSTQAAPAVRVAQLVRQQQIEARDRERLEQELRVARLIQQTLLPKELPRLPGFNVAAYYQPARQVGGDFYDFHYFDDGRIGLVVGDVTDKGVPAALVMATTRTMLRSAAERLESPGAVLERVNDLLVEDIPPKMFVTCLYALLDPKTGRLHFANAGHDLPYVRTADGVHEMRATGMPLGLLGGMGYEEREIILKPGDTVLFYSDGIAEAHAPDGDMFGFPRMHALMENYPGDPDLVRFVLDQLGAFTGPGWEQEDDVTMVTLEYLRQAAAGMRAVEPGWQVLDEFEVPSAVGNERIAMERVAQIAAGTPLAADRVERLKTAVAEATMNGMEHGNKYRAEIPVRVRVCRSDDALSVTITDQGGGQFIREAEAPDLDAKLAGLQSPRGWGLFLIQNMVDEMRVTSDDLHHTVELIMNFQ
ncbi:MAG: SpoIIE family protein phosphatase [Caldilineales bacterium]